MTRLRKIAIGAGAGIGLGAMFFGMCWVFVTVMDALTAALGRNVAAVVKIADVATKALADAGKPAGNMQQVVETLASDPEAKQIVRAAVIDQCMYLVEAGGGGIEGARKADLAISGGDIKHSPSFWVTMALLPLVYMIVGSVVGWWGKEWPSDVRAAIATAIVSLIVGGAAGYYWGQTTSRNRTPAP